MDEENKMNLFTRFISSTAKFENYRIFAKESAGRAVLYLLMFTLIFGTIKLSKFIYNFNMAISEGINIISEDMPDFELKDGELFVEGEMPIVIQEDNDIFIIDTSGNSDESVLNSYSTGVLITKDMIIQKDNSIQTKTVRFAEFKDFSMNKEKLIKLMPMIRWGNIFIIIFGLLFYFVGKLIHALILSIAAVIINNSKKLNIPYGGLYGISIYALTLPSLIGVAASLAGITIPKFILISSIIAVFYIWKALNTIKNDDNSNDDIEIVNI